jgi:hypothetical protein
VLLTLLVKQARKSVLNHVEYDDTETHSADEKALDLAAHILNGKANAVKWKIDHHLMPVLSDRNDLIH